MSSYEHYKSDNPNYPFSIDNSEEKEKLKLKSSPISLKGEPPSILRIFIYIYYEDWKVNLNVRWHLLSIHHMYYVKYFPWIISIN